MADIKISALPGASTLTGAETIPLVQGGTTKKVTTDQFLIKDASGNVGVGTASPTHKIDAVTAGGTCYARTSNGTITSFSGVAASVGGAVYGTGTNHPVVFLSNGSERARIDASGNLGLGVTPKTWGSYFKAIQVGDYAVFAHNVQATAAIVASNVYNDDNVNWRYTIGSVPAARYEAGLGNTGAEHRWYLAPSGTAGNPISFTQAMTLDASGNLLVGKTAVSVSSAGCEVLSDGTVYSTLSGSTSGTATMYVYSAGAAAFRFYVNMAGTVFATNTTISAISDQRMKENIRDIPVGLTEILALKPRQFDWKAGKGKDTKNDRGFIAQEFAQVFPDLVDDWKDPAPDGEDPYKSVRADLIPVLVKAIQEQQVQIEALEARLAAAGI